MRRYGVPDVQSMLSKTSNCTSCMFCGLLEVHAVRPVRANPQLRPGQLSAKPTNQTSTLADRVTTCRSDAARCRTGHLIQFQTTAGEQSLDIDLRGRRSIQPMIETGDRAQKPPENPSLEFMRLMHVLRRDPARSASLNP